MKSVIASAAVLAGLAAAHPMSHTAPRNLDFGCGTVASDAFIEASKAMAEREQAEKAIFFKTNNDSTIVVQTYFHNVYASETAEDGYVDDDTLQEQLDVMNDNWKPSGVSFELVKITRTENADWAVNADESAMRSALHEGDYKTLNVYFQKEIDGNLGYCYFPEPEPTEEQLTLDGCSILAASVPGGSATNFNEGKTATHEIGHWFGLFHTFQDGCDGGDLVDDTPAQSSPTSGCPKGRDSCPAAGLDPIHNYMDYSYDSCYEEFTAGQTARAQNMFAEYRA